MNILIAPDKFKGTLSALQVCKAIELGVSKGNPKAICTLHPLADGGDGSIEILKSFLSLQAITVETTDPLGRNISADYHVSLDTAFIELATASGYTLLSSDERNPMLTSTQGTGILLRDAIDNGYKKVFLFLGGSATNDAAMGIASACGYRFLDEFGEELKPIGGNLIRIATIDTSQVILTLNTIEINVLCDVKNPLYGSHGAAFVYGPQKGATQQMVEVLDNGLEHFAKVVLSTFEIDLQAIIGGGAAGGCAAGMVGLLKAKLQKGTEAIFAMTNFEEKVKEADIVITGEGRLDLQTLQGKVISGVAALAQKYKKPLYVFVGQNTLSNSESEVLDAEYIYSILDAARGDKMIAFVNGTLFLEEAAKKMIKDI